ncbi:MAG: esterase-like activity of phytase family protein [Alphaproteobacteria bacterium]|nr:esterase-like activity of phytase family protein [Alphaproteobacteria bacterium]
MRVLSYRSRAWALAMMLLLAVPMAFVAPRSSLPETNPARLTLRTAPLALNLEDRAATRVGKLIWRGGLSLDANHRDFGGWSGLWVASDGAEMRAISDEGSWLVARLRYDAAGHLAGADDGVLGRLKSPDGAWLRGKSWTDAESFAMLPDGTMLVGFERRHRVLRYPAGNERQGGGLAGTPVPFAAPADLARAPSNAGLEAMTVLSDGRLFLLTEDFALRPGTTAGWIGVLRDGTPMWTAFHYTLLDGFRPTSAATLPDGDIVLLERSAALPAGWRVRVMRLRVASLVPGAVVRAEELARLATPFVTENLEGVVARRGRGGETLLWLISDDNFSFLQQTVLLHFALAD